MSLEFVKLIDTETLEIKVIETNGSKWWWSKGNGCCDCNRRLYFGHEDQEDCTLYRYLILDAGNHVTDDNTYSVLALLDTFNSDYDPSLVDTVMNRLDVIMEREEKLTILLEE